MGHQRRRTLEHRAAIHIARGRNSLTTDLQYRKLLEQTAFSH